MRYPGGKGQAGVYQRIINLMPPHEVYIETHLGGGNILERKKPATASIGIDADEAVCAIWRARATPSTTIIHGDAAAFLRGYRFTGRELIYSDPPYVMTTRKSGPRYRHEYSDEQHRDLVSLLLTVKAWVMLSGYRCPLYDELLAGWRRGDFPVMTRGHSWAIESLWLNFEPGARLHDFRYLGADFRERERLKRKRLRWRARLESLPESERLMLLDELVRIARNDDVDVATVISGDRARAPAPLAVSGDVAGKRYPLAASDDGRGAAAGIAVSAEGGRP